MGLTRAGAAAAAGVPRPDTRPNVLWIITDDQMRSTLRSMDRTWRRLVRKGVHFPRGYSAMPLCGPARASILTSVTPTTTAAAAT